MHFKDFQYILKQAESHEVYMEKAPYDQAEYEDRYYKQIQYLNKRIIQNEWKQPFVYKEKHLYGKEENLLDLADRALLVKLIIDDI